MDGHSDQQTDTIIHVQQPSSSVAHLRKRHTHTAASGSEPLLLQGNDRNMIDSKRGKEAYGRFCDFILKIYWLYIVLMLAVGVLLVTVYLSSWNDSSALMMVAFVKFFLAPAWVFMIMIMLVFRNNLVLVFAVMLFAGLFAGFVMGIVAQLYFEDAVIVLINSKAAVH